jgi:hypothetical protein
VILSRFRANSPSTQRAQREKKGRKEEQKQICSAFLCVLSFFFAPFALMALAVMTHERRSIA